MTTIDLETPDGSFIAGFTSQGLARLSFPSASPSARLDSRVPAGEKIPRAWIKATHQAVRAALLARPTGELPPLDLSSGTEFRRQVWDILRTIPPGRTLNYLEVAVRLGKPGGARAVGQACGANPIPLLIPCHRVLAAGSRLGGFSGGLDWKRRLLEREGVVWREDARP